MRRADDLDAEPLRPQVIEVRRFVAAAELGEHVGVGVSAHLWRRAAEGLIELEAGGVTAGGEAGEEGWGEAGWRGGRACRGHASWPAEGAERRGVGAGPLDVWSVGTSNKVATPGRNEAPPERRRRWLGCGYRTRGVGRRAVRVSPHIDPHPFTAVLSPRPAPRDT